MTTNSSNPTTDSPPAAAQISGDLAAGLTSADAIAAEHVQNLQWVYQARVSRLSRTADSLKAEFGADDPGVKAAVAAVDAPKISRNSRSQVV